jgi:TolA-binding protein
MAIDKSFEPTLKQLGKFRKVGGHPWPKQYCLYYLGLSHLRRGDKKKGDAAKARQYFERLVREVPDSRFIFKAYMGVADSYHLGGKYEDAARAFRSAHERFKKMGGAPGIPFEQVRAVRERAMLALLREAEMFDRAKKHDKAVSLFGQVANRARDYPEIEFLAKSGAVKALVSARSPDLAIERANDLIAEGERKGLTQFLGGAYMALADCYFQRFTDAEKEKRATSLQDLVTARYNYLRVVALYFEDQQVLPKAGYRAGRCHERLSKLSKSEGARAVEQAKRQYTLVAREFPESQWAGEAKSRLAALGVEFKTEEEEEKEEEAAAKDGGKKGAGKKGKRVLPVRFEGTSFGNWAVTGKAFGSGPARGKLKGQGDVTGFRGKGLANSLHGGDRSKGTLTSPAFKIEKKYINFLLGGGKHARQTCVNLLVDGRPVRTATGNNKHKLEPVSWDVGKLKGKTARIQIVDNFTGGWGHVTVDEIVASDSKSGGGALGGGRRRRR